EESQHAPALNPSNQIPDEIPEPERKRAPSDERRNGRAILRCETPGQQQQRKRRQGGAETLEECSRTDHSRPAVEQLIEQYVHDRLGIRDSGFGIRGSGFKQPAPSTQHSALSTRTQHSAPSTQHQGTHPPNSLGRMTRTIAAAWVCLLATPDIRYRTPVVEQRGRLLPMDAPVCAL